VLLIGIPGGQELIIIALVLVLLFGGAKIPALMRGMGQGIREFRKEIKGPSQDTEKAEEPEKDERKEP
jgi:sec-independent protein translocase protein TatA